MRVIHDLLARVFEAAVIVTGAFFASLIRLDDTLSVQLFLAQVRYTGMNSRRIVAAGYDSHCVAIVRKIEAMPPRPHAREEDDLYKRSYRDTAAKQAASRKWRDASNTTCTTSGIGRFGLDMQIISETILEGLRRTNAHDIGDNQRA